MKILVYDHGLCLEAAVCLAKAGHTVAYYAQQSEAFPHFANSMLGHGVPHITRTDDFWRLVDSVDMICAFDTFSGDVVDYLRGKGKAVWGAGSRAEELEHDRWECKRFIASHNLPVNGSVRFTNVAALEKHLRTCQDRFVKVNKFRGDIETFHHTDWNATSSQFIGELYSAFGSANVDFVVEQPVSGIEIGQDTFVVGRQMPSTCLVGPEAKDAGYIGKVCQTSKLPSTLTEPARALAERIAGSTFMSTEVRLPSGILLDPTIRAPHPPMAAMLTNMTNFATLVERGARGIVENPAYHYPYVAALTLKSPWAKDHWLEVEFDEVVLRNRIYFQRVLVKDGHYFVLPESEIIATIAASGNTPDDAVKLVKHYVEQVKARQLEYDLSCLSTIIDETLPKMTSYGV